MTTLHQTPEEKEAYDMILRGINESPTIQSLLYDMNLMPEQVQYGSSKHECMVNIAWHFALYAAEREQRTPQPDAAAIRKAALEDLCALIMEQVDGNIRPTIRDCVNGHDDVQDIYEYCDVIENAIDTALSTTLVEPAIPNFCKDCGQRNADGLVHTCSPQALDAMPLGAQDAPIAFNWQSMATVPRDRVVTLWHEEGNIEFHEVWWTDDDCWSCFLPDKAFSHWRDLMPSPTQSKDA